ncbi:UNVERIFIED_ORG: hypothetical protein GGE64_005041 [Rhizobium etli]
MSFLVNSYRYHQSAPATLTADAGTFTLTGISAALLRALKLQAAAGSFALTGIDADLTTGNPDLVAETGTFTLTGNAAALSRALRLAASEGAFSLNGNAAALNKIFTLLAGSGSFALTGVSNTFTRTLVMAAAQASFTLTGNAATLSYNGSDPHFSSVVLLCGFNGADGATTSSDESNAAHALTFAGNAQLDTAQFKFGTASLLLDGTGDFVTAADSADWQLGATNSSPWTIECWVRWNVLDGNNRGIMGQGGSAGWTMTGSSTIGQLSMAGSNFTTITTTGTAMTTGQWYHVAVDHDATGKIRVYIDGVMRASATPANSAIADNGTALALGAQTSGGIVDMNGWLDEVRITKGVARYATDTSFSVPTAAFPRS